jgi:two-component system, OmpR family, sensor histidine kinase KdpD
MSSDVTYVRSEDLLDDSAPKRLARSFRLTRRRQLWGLALSATLLTSLTLLLQGLDSHLALDGQVLLYLLAVVVVAIVGGVVVAVLSAVAAALLINYFFVAPVHTLTVADPDQVVGLAVFVAVAALVSGAIELAVRRAHAAERAQEEAETMAALAGPELDGGGSLHEILKRALETFGMESVVLKARQRGTGEWIDVEHVGWAPGGEEAPFRFDVPVGAHIRMVGRGPALFAEDQRVLEAFASAARTAYEGGLLSGEAEEARVLATIDQQRTSLLAAVGHDLRTPIAGIKAGVSSLRQADVQWSDEERRELLATIEESTDRLDDVVANLLDASRLQTGAMAVQVGAVALDEVVAGALVGLHRGAERVRIDVPEDLPLVRADPGLLQRVLINVLDNALRHGGGDGPVEVVARAGGGSAKLAIIDHGQGVSEQQRESLFEPFQHADDRETAGVGLGLSVARGFVEAMGGAMVADATPDGGLTMRIRLDLSVPADSGADAG